MSASLTPVCPACMTVTMVTSEQIRLVLVFSQVVQADGGVIDGEPPRRDYFEWHCATCKRLTRRLVTHNLLRLLLLGGVQPIICDASPELLEDHDGPALTEDDALDLHLALQKTDYLVLERRIGRPFTADDELAWHIGLSRADYIAAVFECYGVSGTLAPVSQQAPTAAQQLAWTPRPDGGQS